MSNIYLRFLVLIFGISLFTPNSIMAYEEADYETVYQTKQFDVRSYGERLVVQTSYGDQNGGFRKLFNYISGSNDSAEKIAMTIPVTQSDLGEGMVMQFYLPSKFNKESTPNPDDRSLEISTIDAGYYAVMKFSGRSNEKNFNKHSEILKKELVKENIKIIGPSIKATYNGPFTLPRFRRNESMFLVSWDSK